MYHRFLLQILLSKKSLRSSCLVVYKYFVSLKDYVFSLLKFENGMQNPEMKHEACESSLDQPIRVIPSVQIALVLDRLRSTQLE